MKKPVPETEEMTLWTRLQEERQQFLLLLEQLENSVFQPLLVKGLLFLQGPPASHAKIIRVNFISKFEPNKIENDTQKNKNKLLAGCSASGPLVARQNLRTFIDEAINETQGLTNDHTRSYRNWRNDIGNVAAVRLSGPGHLNAT